MAGFARAAVLTLRELRAMWSLVTRRARDRGARCEGKTRDPAGRLQQGRRRPVRRGELAVAAAARYGAMRPLEPEREALVLPDIDQ
jgi:hypothetical protein